MKKFQIIGLLLVLVTVWSCDRVDDEMEADVGTLSLSIVANFDGEELFSAQEYVLPDGKKAKISQFNFYISDASVNFLEDGVAKATDLSEVEFVELTQTPTSPLDPTDNTYQYFNLPAGDYTGLDFTFGLGEELNDKTPADQDLGDGNPLRKSSHYWQAWGSYIFMKLQGTIDFNEDGILDTETENIVYHTGSENDGLDGDDVSAHKLVNMPVNFSIAKDRTTDVKLSIDISDILYDASGAPNWDIEGRKTTHNPDDFQLVLDIVDKAAQAFKMAE